MIVIIYGSAVQVLNAVIVKKGLLYFILVEGVTRKHKERF
jgi:hypothetical protein